jgi:multidrug efflux pump subunit AcrB
VWISLLSLRRPYTVAVLALAVFLAAAGSVARMNTDVFPVIDIPVVSAVWSYPGMTAEDIERRIVNVYERAASATVDGIARVDSQCISGLGLLRFYFQQGQDIGAAIAQLASVAQTASRYMPPGTLPPIVLRFNASNLPVAQLTVSSTRLTEQQLFDYGNAFLRMRLFTIPGLGTPAPYGGRTRQVMVEADPAAMRSRNVSPKDVVQAVLQSNVITPAGSSRMGGLDLDVVLNNSPSTVEEFGSMPIKAAPGAARVYLRDVARVSDGFAVQGNIVRVDGRRATYLTILKKAQASTIAVVDAARQMLPLIKRDAPEGIELKVDFDQSLFVKAAITSVLREGALAALLVGGLIVVLLGSWRGALIVWTSIPLAVGLAVVGLAITGQSLNVMTLSGLALAIGMLVDDATVAVESIHRRRESGEALEGSIVHGCLEVATPALAASLVVCIVFSPVALLEGPARYLFVPLSLSVVFAMIGSYAVSRTVVPALAFALYRRTAPAAAHAAGWGARGRRLYARVLSSTLRRPRLLLGAAALVTALGLASLARSGFELFPETDSGQMRMQLRAPAGTRIEATEARVAEVEREIKRIVPADDLDNISVNIGIPTFFNLAFVASDNSGGQDAEIRVALKSHHRPTAEYRRRLRQALAERWPGTSVYFLPADIVSQVLSFGAAAPIDVELEGKDVEMAAEAARALREELRTIPGLVDTRIPQVLQHPALAIDVDRDRAVSMGLSQRDVADSLLTALSSSATVAPAFWVSPANGVNYPVAVQVPLEKAASMDDLMGLPVSGPGRAGPAFGELAPTLASVAVARPTVTKGLISHRSGQRVIEVQAGVEGDDWGRVIQGVRAAMRRVSEKYPKLTLRLRGQGETMSSTFARLGVGLGLAVALVFLVLAVFFQSWIDPLIVLCTVPGILVGVSVTLALTGTTINIQSLIGSVMAVGVGVANSILLVHSANDLRIGGVGASVAVLAAAERRLRPVLMTAAAMVLGMLPTAIGMGVGAEENAPLGRSMIGGLSVSTVGTLLVVPAVYSLLRRRSPRLAELNARGRGLQEAGAAVNEGGMS